ncbi:MAG: TIGR04053 family radical SAM/SPASM domain-containing protein [Deltaproteobacteria bacterium]|nr:TIGR04053 family radical SAM/SPASM domain-containing protein [Deltaproteobacteria bacterium]
MTKSTVPPDRAFDDSPFVVFYETTQACDLVCAHCRACAQTMSHPGELGPGQALALLDDLRRFPAPPLVVLTGGDPMKRADIHDLVAHGTSIGLSMAMTPSATPLVTHDALARLKGNGLARLAVSLDGAGASSHDGLRGVAGSYRRTLEILNDAAGLGLSLQVNTTVHVGNVDELPAIVDQIEAFGLDLWSVFFLVPVGRALATSSIAPARYEDVFEFLYAQSRSRSFAIKTTEAPHYRRYLLQRRKAERRGAAGVARADTPEVGAGARGPGMIGTNDGKGVLFVGHTGFVQPSGFLPLPCGRFPASSVVEVYQSHPLFVALRDADRLGGKCGACEYRTLCGGSRARSYSVAGDALASEPDCIYVPPGWHASQSEPVHAQDEAAAVATT